MHATQRNVRGDALLTLLRQTLAADCLLWRLLKAIPADPFWGHSRFLLTMISCQIFAMPSTWLHGNELQFANWPE
jgi:hypothetical protein